MKQVVHVTSPSLRKQVWIIGTGTPAGKIHGRITEDIIKIDFKKSSVRFK
jgi:hypothetical protein